MAKIGRPGLSDDQRRRVWELWKQGHTFSEIARLVDRPPGSIFSILQSRGGIYNPKPTARASALTLAEREEISRGLAKGLSIWGIAQRINRAASSVSREISRNKGRENYRAVDAQDRAIRARARPQKLPS